MQQRNTQNYATLKAKDLKYLWHPYTNMQSFGSNKEFPVIVRGEGCYLYDINGKKYFDGISSWWCTSLGHSHPRLIQAMTQQASKLQHCMIGDMSHEPAILLAEKLINIAPKGLTRAFFAGDGSSSVEAALRMSLNYWHNKGRPHKNNFISLQGAYHGDTMGAISVGNLTHFHHAEGLHSAFKCHKIHPPRCSITSSNSNNNFTSGVNLALKQSQSGMHSAKEVIKKYHKNTAALIVEPLCQGAAGMHIYPAEYLRELREFCKKYDILMIADEIAVGLGRTGAMFACNLAGITPDILLLGKALSGGYLPISATLVKEEIMKSFDEENSHIKGGTSFKYGNTFSGNPLSAAIALEALTIYEEMNFEQLVQKMQPHLDKVLNVFKNCLPHANRTERLGFIIACEIGDNPENIKLANTIVSECEKLGLLLRPLGSVIYIWAPLITTKQDFTFIANTLDIAIQNALRD